MSRKKHIISCLIDFKVDGLIAAAATMTKESTCKKPFMEYFVSHKDERLSLHVCLFDISFRICCVHFWGIEL